MSRRNANPEISVHVPVMPEEVLTYLDPQPGQTIVDCTLGGGGHARRIAEKLAPTGKLIGLDQDPSMLERAAPGLAGLPVQLVHRNFEDLSMVLQELQVPKVDGVLAD